MIQCGTLKNIGTQNVCFNYEILFFGIHVYVTPAADQKQRERDLVTAEMIPTTATKLSFLEKFMELHYKMWFTSTENLQNHMYSSEPHEWPLMSRGIAYWVSSDSNVS